MGGGLCRGRGGPGEHGEHAGDEMMAMRVTLGKKVAGWRWGDDREWAREEGEGWILGRWER